MRIITALLYLVSLTGILFVSCSSERDVVSKSFVQKRKYRPGWHIDIPQKPRDQEDLALRRQAMGSAEERITREEVRMSAEPPDLPEISSPRSLSGRSDDPKEVLDPAVAQRLTDDQADEATASIDLHPIIEILGTRKVTATDSAVIPQEGSEETNTLAIVGFVLSFLVPIAGIVLCAIALGQIKRTGERGRGLAQAGLIIGIVFMVIIIFAAAA